MLFAKGGLFDVGESADRWDQSPTPHKLKSVYYFGCNGLGGHGGVEMGRGQDRALKMVGGGTSTVSGPSNKLKGARGGVCVFCVEF